MKNCLILLLLTFIVLYGGPSLEAQQAQPQQIDPVMLKPVDIRMNPASLDDYMIELAKAGDVNFIADATRFPAQINMMPVQGQRFLGSFILGELLNKRKLNGFRFDNTTFLFWSKPDNDALARLLLTREKARPWLQLPGAQEMGLQITEYAKRLRGWDGQTPGFQLQVKIGDLPPELKTTIRDKIYENLSRYAGHWLTDTVWQEAKLRVLAVDVPKGYEEIAAREGLYLEGIIPDNSRQFRGIGPVNLPPERR